MATVTNNQRSGNQSYNGTARNLVPGKVKRIILDGSSQEAAEWGGYDAVGLIYFTKIKQKNAAKEKTTDNEKVTVPFWDGVAKPLFPHLKYYPLINEIVPIITLTGKDYLESPGADWAECHYYFPPINLWSHTHHNTLPALENYNEEDKLSELRKNEDYAQAGLLRRTTDGDLDYEVALGEYFNERLNIKPLRPYEGDHIIEGRFGNSIRFGATARSKLIPISQSNNWSAGAKGDIGDPITIIRNGQAEGLDEMGWVPTVEDINLDASSIYLTSNQKIDNLIVSAPDCWYSFGTNVEIKQDPNQEAKKFLDSPIDFMQSDDEAETETSTDESTSETSSGIETPSNDDRCPPGQVYDEELQQCVIPEVTVEETSITEKDAGLVEEEDTNEYYQLDFEGQEPEIIPRPPLPSSYQIATSANNCGNCNFHQNNQCNKWSAKVRAKHENPWICGAWQEIKPLPPYRIAGGAREGQIEYLKSDGTYNFLQSFITLSDGEKRAVFFFGKQVGFRLQISVKHMQGLVYIDEVSSGGFEENIRVAKMVVSQMDSKIFREAVLNGGVGPGK